MMSDKITQCEYCGKEISFLSVINHERKCKAKYNRSTKGLKFR